MFSSLLIWVCMGAGANQYMCSKSLQAATMQLGIHQRMTALESHYTKLGQDFIQEEVDSQVQTLLLSSYYLGVKREIRANLPTPKWIDQIRFSSKLYDLNFEFSWRF